ncbi:MAG TPA: type II secretion system protein [Tepidisphaeraceae bacterium]|jgi:prepilin-type N-terminal cleavage/methylation domain-containing protein
MKHLTRRHGFTLIELLVVIGIILVLTTIILTGIKHVTNLTIRHETQAELKVCEDLLREYRNINGLKNIEAPAASIVGTPPRMKLPSPNWISGEYPLPMFVDSADATEIILPEQSSTLATLAFAGSSTQAPPTSGSAGDFSDQSDFSNPRWVSNAIRWTQGVMFILLKDPKNRALVSALPSKRILETPPSYKSNTGVTNGGAQTPYTIDAAVPLDGFGNPIIFVPRGGMHVWMKLGTGTSPGTGGLQEYVVRTSGTYRVNAGPLPPVGANDRPFFASAGQDGYFTDLKMAGDKAIDNLYSFQEQ